MDSSKRLANLLGHTKQADFKKADVSKATLSQENTSPMGDSNKDSENSPMNNISSANLLLFGMKKQNSIDNNILSKTTPIQFEPVLNIKK